MYPDDKSANATYADILCAQNKYEEAKEVLQDLLNDKLRNNNLRAKILNILSRIYYYEKNYKDAETCLCEAVLLTDGKYYRQIKNLCDIYIKEEKYDEARYLLNKYRNKDNDYLFNVIGAEVEYNDEKHDKSLHLLENTRDDYLAGSEIQKKYYLLGKIYYSKLELEKAEEFFKKALTIKNVFFWVSYFYIACIKSKNGEIDSAIAICEEINEHNQDIYGVNDLLASLYIKKRDPNKIIKVVNDIDDESKKYYNLSKVELQKNNIDEALEYANKAIVNVTPAIKNKCLYLLSIINFKKENYDETLKYLNEMDEISPDLENEIERIRFYIQYVRGEKTNTNAYIARQLDNYNRSLALGHIYRRHKDDFNKNINIEELFDELSINIKNYSIDNLKCFDVYRVPMVGVGNQNNNYTGVLTVVCIPNSTNILTMYPDQSLPSIVEELDVKENFDKKTKTKRLSQIDKFNKRYNL